MIELPEDALKALPAMFRSRKVVIGDNRDNALEWDGETASVLPLVQVGKYIGCVDTSFGSSLLWDGVKWHKGYEGVFLDEVVFLYEYNFTDGAIFLRVKS